MTIVSLVRVDQRIGDYMGPPRPKPGLELRLCGLPRTYFARKVYCLGQKLPTTSHH